jgi:hypothetical protein
VRYPSPHCVNGCHRILLLCGTHLRWVVILSGGFDPPAHAWYSEWYDLKRNLFTVAVVKVWQASFRWLRPQFDISSDCKLFLEFTLQFLKAALFSLDELKKLFQFFSRVCCKDCCKDFGNSHDVDRQVSCLRVTDAQPLVIHSPNCHDNLNCPT